MTALQMLCPPGLRNNPNRPLRQAAYITIHCTGNRSPGAGAESHARYQLGGSGGRAASWHYTADAGGAWQSFEDGRECWHAGTARGNAESIGVEICVNSREGFYNACDCAARLAASLMARHGIPIGRVVQHNFWSGKDCPAELRSGEWGLGWEGFLGMVGRWAAEGAAQAAQAAGAAQPPAARLAGAVELLRQKGVIQSPEYWLATAPQVRHLPELIESMARLARG